MPAQKPKPPKKTTKTAKTPKNVRESAVRAALDLAATQGWEQVTLPAVAKHAGIGLAELRDHIEDRLDILAAYGRMVDKRVMEAASGDADSGTPPRDRLFDLVMERLDVLSEDREGVKAILSSFRFDPKQAVISLPHLGRSMIWMLEAAGVSTGGIKGAMRVAGMTALYLNTLRTWRDDESADMSATMAALDKNLERAEKIVSLLRLDEANG